MTDEIKGRIALFGGTFAPPHLGHVHAVKTAARELSVDRIVIMPTATPPHKVKAGDDTPEERLEMCRAAFGDIPSVTVSDYEIKSGGISYTYKTLEYLSKLTDDISLICGTDMFMTLGEWRRAERIFELAEIVCVPRYSAGNEELLIKKEEYENIFSARVMLLGDNPFEISSSEIRERIMLGGELDTLLPSGVIEIIKRKNLYGK